MGMKFKVATSEQPKGSADHSAKPNNKSTSSSANKKPAESKIPVNAEEAYQWSPLNQDWGEAYQSS